MIVRTYACLNRHCRHEFDHAGGGGGGFPPCPRCRGLRTQWIPRPVAIRSPATTHADTIARQLAADFGMTNFASPQVGRAAIRGRPGYTTTPQPNGPMTYEPQPGWRVNMPAEALAGDGKAFCAPTGVTAKIKVDPNAGALKESDPRMSMNAMRANTKIEGSHRPK